MDCVRSHGKDLGRTFTPFIGTLFIFLLMCNYIGVFGFEEPTLDINLPLGLGILGFGIAVYQAMRFKGFSLLLGASNGAYSNHHVPLNLIGELSKLSIGFRLFGNIMGGALTFKLYRGSLVISCCR